MASTHHASLITHHSGGGAPRPKTIGQVRAIFGEGRKCGLDKEGIDDVVEDVTKRTRHVSALSFSEAQQVIQRLKGKLFVPLRTLQYRRAKAGIKQVVQEGQLKLIAELATQRDWQPESLIKFCKRQCGHHPLRSTEDANKVIEALKSMNKRDDLWAA